MPPPPEKLHPETMNTDRIKNKKTHLKCPPTARRKRPKGVCNCTSIREYPPRSFRPWIRCLISRTAWRHAPGITIRLPWHLPKEGRGNCQFSSPREPHLPAVGLPAALCYLSFLCHRGFPSRERHLVKMQKNGKYHPRNRRHQGDHKDDQRND